MAASGGDTVVPTNWSGLIMVAIVIAVIAAATYFGMDFQFGASESSGETEKSLSVKDVFSASARREIAAAEPARVLSRAELTARAPQTASDATSDDNADAWAEPDESNADDDWSSDAESWDTQSDDWDSTDAHWDDVEEQNNSAAASAAPTAAPVATPTAQPARKPVATPKPVAPTPKPTSKPVASAAPKATSPAARRQAPSADALTAWWKDAGGDLAVRFAGTLDKGDQVSDGIAVMFSEPVAPGQGDQNMRLTDDKGVKVQGQWKAAANPALLIMEGLKPGRYTLTISKNIQGRNGNSLAKDASGAVYVY